MGTIIAGPTRAGAAVHGWIAPIAERAPVAAPGGDRRVRVRPAHRLGPTHALRVPFGIALLGVLVAIGIFVLRRETLQEFPA